MRTALLIAIMITLCVCVAGLHSEAWAETGKNTVIPIDPKGLEAIIKNRDCPLLIVAMASWCAPCRAELPTLQKLHETYGAKGLKIIGVSLDVGGPSAIQPLVDKMNLTFPIYWGGEKVTTAFGISGIPLIMVAKNGKIIENILGRRPEKVLINKVVSLLGECGSK
jgi:thiol-disulfide isomerase/thioredoxin